MGNFNWNQGFTLDFDLQSGFSQNTETTKRYLSDMEGFYEDSEAVKSILEKENPLIYEFYELGCPEREGDLAFGTTIVYPGLIGSEYYMTKGHFHRKVDTAEVYYVLEGEGYMVMEDPKGTTREIPLRKGEAVYVPRSFAHRSVNTGGAPLVMFFTFAADAGHDYGTIEKKGYHHMICRKDGEAVVMENKKWD
ncbi:MAG: cupin domain-containing protein [Lachnospiraceae bacterium]|nr:cupin domain-containing protein [Lachnospiraceae bacterium]